MKLSYFPQIKTFMFIFYVDTDYMHNKIVNSANMVAFRLMLKSSKLKIEIKGLNTILFGI